MVICMDVLAIISVSLESYFFDVTGQDVANFFHLSARRARAARAKTAPRAVARILQVKEE